MRKKRFMNNKGVGKYQGILYFVSGDVIIVDKKVTDTVTLVKWSRVTEMGS